MGTLSNKYFNAQAVEEALDKGVAAYDNMGQIELVYNGTDIRFNNEGVNFQQIVDFITTDARFCYMVYNNRVLLTSDMQLTGGTRYVFFETSTTDSGLSKNTVVKVYSADGTAISSIAHSTIANENFSNKVSTIADNDKNSTVHYPSNKAVTEITDEIKEDLSELLQSLNREHETATLTSYHDGWALLNTGGATVTEGYYVSVSIPVNDISYIAFDFSCTIPTANRVGLQFIISETSWVESNLISYVNSFVSDEWIKVPDGANYVRCTIPNDVVNPKIKTYVDKTNSLVGNLTKLSTNDKSNVVAAINEVNSKTIATDRTVKIILNEKENISLTSYHDEWCLLNTGFVGARSDYYVSNSISVSNVEYISPNFAGTVPSGTPSGTYVAIQFVDKPNIFNADNLISYIESFEIGDIIKVPDGANYVRFSVLNSTENPSIKTYSGLIGDNSVTNNKLADNSVTEQKIANLSVSTDKIIDGAVNFNKQSVITKESGDNIFDYTTMLVKDHAWWWVSGGKAVITENQYTTAFSAFLIPIKDENGSLTISDLPSNSRVRSWYMVDSNDNILTSSGSAAISELYYDGYTIQIPSGAVALKLSISEFLANKENMINYGDTKKEYTPYSDTYFIMGNKVLSEFDIDKKLVPSGVLKLPKKFDLVVGDTFEMFYKGILNTINPDVFDIEISFSDGVSRGKAWKRKYEYTPIIGDVGTKTMNVTVRNNDGKTIETKSVNIVVSNVPVSPQNQNNILCVGDSLTSSGTWCSELRRRLIANNGTPVGYGLSNINFIGTKENSDGCKYEGYGGWTFTSYLTENKSSDFMNIYGTFNKTDNDQHSVYKDVNNVQWKLETIGSTTIKIIRVSGSGNLPNSGTLTWVSGGSNTENIIYTSSEQASGNPFWSNTKNANDFSAYATRMGVASIDHCIILLGWNSTSKTETEYKAMAKQFIDEIRSDFPNCKITLLGLQVPSRDGFANNYGISWKFYDKLQFVWNLNKWYQDIADEYTGVEFVNIAGQFDTEYNCMLEQKPVNTRNSTSITIQTNGVHPATTGYLQISDAVLRSIVSRL